LGRGSDISHKRDEVENQNSMTSRAGEKFYLRRLEAAKTLVRGGKEPVYSNRGKKNPCPEPYGAHVGGDPPPPKKRKGRKGCEGRKGGTRSARPEQRKERSVFGEGHSVAPRI